MTRSIFTFLAPLGLAAAVVFGAGIAHAADPTTADCLSANDNSISLRSQHKLRAARSELLICAAATCPADIRTECARRVSEVNASMPTIVFDAKDASGNDLSAVKVTMDGQALVERLEGTALSIDPGEHAFVFETAGQQPVQKTFIIREGEKDRRERVAFGGGAPAPVAGPAAVPVSGPAPMAGPTPMAGPAPQPGMMPPPVQQAPGPDQPKKGGNAKKTIGWVLAVVGVGAGGVGIFEGVTAMSKDKDSKNAAKSPDPNENAKVHGLHQDALSAQTIGIVAGSVGVVAFGAGLYMILSSSGDSGSVQASSKKGLEVLPVVSTTGAGFVLGQRF